MLIFLFVLVSTNEVLTVGKRSTRSTHYKDPAEIPSPDAIWSTDFHLLLLMISLTRMAVESFIDPDGGHYEDHRQKSRFRHGSFYVTHKPETFVIALSPYAFHNMFNVSAGDFWSKTQNLIFVHSSMSDIFK